MIRKLLPLCLLVLLVVGGFRSLGQSAHVEFIHNAPDVSLPSVDIYVDGTMLDNIGFRKATPFITLPASDISITIAHAGINDTIQAINVTLQPDSSYYVVLSGVTDTTGYRHNPNGAPINFAINVLYYATLGSSNPTECSLQFFNGATDAPLYNYYGREQREQLFSNVGYSQFAPGYRAEIIYQPVVIDRLDSSYTHIDSTYLINLWGHNKQSALVFSSGFQHPSANHNGAPFALFAVFENGSVVQLTDTAIADLQLIHNAADTNAIAFDVYLNDNLLWPDFFFRTASPYLDVPAGHPLRIGLAPADSYSYTQVFDSFTVTLNNAESYIGFLDGVLNTSGFAPNPNGRNINLNLVNRSNARQIPVDTNKVDLFFFNGATDEGGINIQRTDSLNILAFNIEYGDTSPYTELGTKLYNLNVTPGNNINDILATYQADLSLLKGHSLAVFMSGFVDSTLNNNGPSLGMFAARSDGSIIQFPLVLSSAQAQFIHNSADSLLAAVTIYINGNAVVNELSFRHATSFAGVPAGTTMNIGIAPLASTSVIDTVRNFPITLTPNSTNVLMLEGVLNPVGYALNPDGRDIRLTMRVLNDIHTKATTASDVDIKMILGGTDEPANDFILDKTLPPIFDNMNYGDTWPYESITPAQHSLYISPHGDDTVFTRQYTAQFSPYAGTSLTVFSSGFISPAANKNGAPFWLWAADTSGNTFPLTDINSVININSINYINIYPNPANNFIEVINKENEAAHVQIFDINGKEVKDLGVMNSNTLGSYSLDGMPDGMYFIRLTGESGDISTGKFVKE